MDFNQIEIISNNMFQSFTELVDLNLGNNLIETIEADAFAKNSEIRSFNLKANRINQKYSI